MNEKIEWKIIRFDCIPSTSDYAKSLRQNGENAVIIAAEQSGGRGTKGRSFSSEKGGVYLSALTFYKNFPACKAFQIMAGAATAVCKTLESFGLQPNVKWPNDIYVNDKKICGILIENTFSGSFVANSVVGIGLNVNNSLPKELAKIATTMREILGEETPVLKVEERLIENLGASFFKGFLMEEYTSRLGYLGVPATLLVGEETLVATPCGVTEKGELIALVGTEKKTFSAAEVSLRI